MLDILGDHRRENVVQVIPCEERPPADPNEDAALRYKRMDQGPTEDAHSYDWEEIVGHATQEDWALWVKVVWTGNPIPTWEPKDNVPHETLRLLYGA